MGFETKRTTRAGVVLIGLAACTCAADAAAQQARVGLEEIVVTAQRSQQRLQDVPVAVTAQSGAELERKGAVNIIDLQFTAPGLSLATSPAAAAGGSAQVFIRGVGQIDYSATQEPDVPIYVDGVYVARPFGSVFDFLDLDRVEVLRGPQGTLFGRNALGGAIQIISKAPTDERSARAKVTVGDYGRRDVEAVVNQPLSSTLSVRLAASASDSDGYGKLLPSGLSTNDDHNTYLRGQARWRPDDVTDIVLRGEAFTHRATTGLQQLVSITNTPILAAYNTMLTGQGFAPITAAMIPSDPYTGLSGVRLPDRNEGWSFALDATRQIGAVTLKSITAYRRLRADTAFDFIPAIYPLLTTESSTREHQLTQELQLSGKSFGERLRWIVGGFYFHEQNRQEQLAHQRQNIIRTGPGPYDFAADANTGLSTTVNDQATDSYALYAQADYEILPRLTATLGLRGSRESKDLGSSAGTGASKVNLRGFGTVSENWTQLTPKYGLQYKLTDDVLVYGSISKGFRAGGFNGRVSTPTPPVAYGPEKLIAYEAGIKSEFLDHRLRVNLAGFYYDYQNYQANTSVVQNGVVAIIVSNAAALHTYGAELETSFQVTPQLRLSGFVATLHPEFADIVANTTAIRASSQPPNAPKFNAGVSAQYSQPLSNWGEATLRGDYTYKSKTQFFLPNEVNEAQPGYGVANARLTLTPADEAYEVAIFGTNIFDRHYRIYGQSTASTFGAVVEVPGAPARWGASLAVKF